MAAFQAAQRAKGDDTGPHHDLTVRVTQEVQAAIAADIDPTSPVVDGLIGEYARAFSQTDTIAFRAAVLQRLEVAADPRTQRYLQLLAQINGWGPPPTSPRCSTGSPARCAPTTPRRQPCRGDPFHTDTMRPARQTRTSAQRAGCSASTFTRRPCG
jgi:hypothetical protein